VSPVRFARMIVQAAAVESKISWGICNEVFKLFKQAPSNFP
jgi:hypothetical protein